MRRTAGHAVEQQPGQRPPRDERAEADQEDHPGQDGREQEEAASLAGEGGDERAGRGHAEPDQRSSEGLAPREPVGEGRRRGDRGGGEAEVSPPSALATTNTTVGAEVTRMPGAPPDFRQASRSAAGAPSWTGDVLHAGLFTLRLFHMKLSHARLIGELRRRPCRSRSRETSRSLPSRDIRRVLDADLGRCAGCGWWWDVLRALVGRRRAFALLSSHARVRGGLRRRRAVRRPSGRRLLRQPLGDGPGPDEEPDLAAGAGRVTAPLGPRVYPWRGCRSGDGTDGCQYRRRP